LGFHDEYVQPENVGSGQFISKEEKDVLISDGIPFAITALAEDPNNSYGPRWIAAINCPSFEDEGEMEERRIGFPMDSGVTTRDDMLRAMAAYFEENGPEEVWVALEKPKNAILIVPAEAPAAAAPKPKPKRTRASAKSK
jgi:hypothetical protein